MQATSSPRSDSLEELAVALRDVYLGIRRDAPGDDHDKAALGLLSHLTSLGPIRAGDLADAACLDPSTISRHLRVLEDDGHLLRSADPDDRRATLIEVSPSGRRLVAAARSQRIALLTRAVADWPRDDVRTLAHLVRRLADDLESR